MTDYASMTEALIKADESKVVGLVEAALQDGADPREILNTGLIKGMDVVGEKMESGDMFIPEVLMSAKCMSAAVAIIKPLLTEGAIDTPKKVIIGTVKGDLHDIGKNLVQMMLGSSGFEVVDLGVDVEPDGFLQAIKDHNADILGLSALLTTTMPMMKKTIDVLVESGIRDSVKIIVGGAPVTQAFASEIGADGFASDAGSANKLAKTLFN
jgi:5-methyltetrahydrofolate--homocysteine methyltransferase